MRLRTNLKAAFEEVVENRNSSGLAVLLEAMQQEFGSQSLATLERMGQPRGFSTESLVELVTVFLRAAFVAPSTLIETLDMLSRAWLEGRPEFLMELADRTPPYPLPSVPWQLFWQNMEAALLDDLLERVRLFNAGLDSAVQEAYIGEIVRREGVAEAIKTHFVRPVSTRLESLAAYAPGTLGYAFYHQLADNNLSLDFIKDRPDRVFEDPAADYVGLRVYQTHDLWHVLLGYDISGLDELSLQGFQLAQVGTPSAATLLGLFLARGVLGDFYSLTALLESIFEGWQHGRQTPPLLPVKWEELWEQPLARVRQTYRLQTLRDYKLQTLPERKRLSVGVGLE